MVHRTRQQTPGAAADEALEARDNAAVRCRHAGRGVAPAEVDEAEGEARRERVRLSVLVQRAPAARALLQAAVVA